MADGTWAYVVDGCGVEGQCFVPDVEIINRQACHMYRAARGYSASLVVLSHTQPYIAVGWIKSETLGYKSAKDWYNWNRDN